MYTPLSLLIHSLIWPKLHQSCGQLLPSSLTLLLFSYAQNHLQTGLLTIFPQSSSKLKPITTTETLLAANMWSVRTADTD